MKLLEGKTAIVTGAARGIGKEIALRFAKEGANIAFTDLVIDENGNPLFAPSKMTTGVENVGEDMEVVKEAFYDLNGVEINRPVSNGVYVKTQTLSNGATRTEKVMVK